MFVTALGISIYSKEVQYEKDLLAIVLTEFGITTFLVLLYVFLIIDEALLQVSLTLFETAQRPYFFLLLREW